MKRIAMVALCLAIVAGVGYLLFTEQVMQYTEEATPAVTHVWECIAANPIPVVLALGTFLLTLVYHKAKGKSLRESLEVAATRVTVVATPTPNADENPVVKRARARATRTQLLTDQVSLQTRHRKLPEEILKAEKNACYTENAVNEAKKTLALKQKAHEEAVRELEALRHEKAQSDAELGEIETELKKLADVV